MAKMTIHPAALVLSGVVAAFAVAFYALAFIPPSENHVSDAFDELHAQMGSFMDENMGMAFEIRPEPIKETSSGWRRTVRYHADFSGDGVVDEDVALVAEYDVGGSFIWPETDIRLSVPGVMESFATLTHKPDPLTGGMISGTTREMRFDLPDLMGVFHPASFKVHGDSLEDMRGEVKHGGFILRRNAEQVTAGETLVTVSAEPGHGPDYSDGGWTLSVDSLEYQGVQQGRRLAFGIKDVAMDSTVVFLDEASDHRWISTTEVTFRTDGSKQPALLPVAEFRMSTEVLGAPYSFYEAFQSIPVGAEPGDAVIAQAVTEAMKGWAEPVFLDASLSMDGEATLNSTFETKIIPPIGSAKDAVNNGTIMDYGLEGYLKDNAVVEASFEVGGTALRSPMVAGLIQQGVLQQRGSTATLSAKYMPHNTEIELNGERVPIATLARMFGVQ